MLPDGELAGFAVVQLQSMPNDKHFDRETPCATQLLQPTWWVAPWWVHLEKVGAAVEGAAGQLARSVGRTDARGARDEGRAGCANASPRSEPGAALDTATSVGSSGRLARMWCPSTAVIRCWRWPMAASSSPRMAASSCCVRVRCTNTYDRRGAGNHQHEDQ